MSLDGESDDAARRQRAGDRGENRSEIVEVNEDIGSDDEIVFGLVRNFVGEEGGEIADHKPVVIPLGFGAGNLRCGEIDANELRDKRAKQRSRKSGAAAEIEQRLKTLRPRQLFEADVAAANSSAGPR